MKKLSTLEKTILSVGLTAAGVGIGIYVFREPLYTYVNENYFVPHNIRKSMKELERNKEIISKAYKELQKHGVLSGKYLLIEFEEQPRTFSDYFRGSYDVKTEYDDKTILIKNVPHYPIPLARPRIMDTHYFDGRSIPAEKLRKHLSSKSGFDVRINMMEKYFFFDMYKDHFVEELHDTPEIIRTTLLDSIDFEKELQANKLKRFNYVHEQLQKSVYREVLTRVESLSRVESGGGSALTGAAADSTQTAFEVEYYPTEPKSSRGGYGPMAKKSDREEAARRVAEEDALVIQQQRIEQRVQLVRLGINRQISENAQNFVKNALNSQVNPHELLTFFRQEGFTIRQGRSHTIVSLQGTPYKTAIPRHAQDIRTGTLRSIFLQTGYLTR